MAIFDIMKVVSYTEKCKKIRGENMIEFKGVTKYFIDGNNKKFILSNASVSFKQGEKIAIVGRSGLGKTTILKLLLGIESVDDGEIEIDGIKVTDYMEKDLLRFRREVVGCVFQNFNLISNLTVEENIMLPTYFYNNNKIKIERLLDEVDLPRSILSQNINTLSGGEKQRVSIARALINSPKLLVADEPTGNLDTENEDKVIKLFKRINEDLNLSIITVTHSDKVAENMDKIYTLKDSKFHIIGEMKNE